MTENIFKMIKENEVKFVDFRFTDPKGKWQHTAQTVESVDEDLLTNGIMFDGSSISGWKSINESDMTLKPDLSTTNEIATLSMKMKMNSYHKGVS